MVSLPKMPELTELKCLAKNPEIAPCALCTVILKLEMKLTTIFSQKISV